MKQILIIAVSLLLYGGILNSAISQQSAASDSTQTGNANDKASAIFAGGCFWCVEADFEKLDGVYEAISGYSGGSKETAKYKTVTYEQTGHIEVVKVVYDPQQVSYSELLEYFWRHIDPTDDQGQFCDKGHSYLSAVYYGDAQEQKIIEDSISRLQKSKPFEAPIVTKVFQRMPFYDAEEYHQDYYKKNPIRYRFYRNGCGRDKRVKELWGS